MKKIVLLIALNIILKNSYSQICSNSPINILDSIQSGSVSVTSSPFDIGNINNVFDGNDGTLARSANTNPLVITLSFNNAINLSQVRVIQSYGGGWFTLESADILSDLDNRVGTYRLLLNQVPTIDGVPIGGPVIEPVSATNKIFRLTVHKNGDNYVHLSEWTLYRPFNNHPDKIISDPASIEMHPGWQIWLDKFYTALVPKFLAVTGTDTSLLSADCITKSWSVSDPSILQLDTTTMKLKALTAGTANLIATIGNYIVTIPINVTRLQSVGDPDLSVRYIKRLPEINYVLNSSNPTIEGWPAAGQSIIWRAHVRNWSGNTYNNVSYQWKKNGTVIASGALNFLPDEEKTVDLSDTWAFQRDSLEFTIDNNNSISEFSKLNNTLKIYTNSISLNLYVEQSLYDYFHVYQNQLGLGTNSWDDWAQILHVNKWNEMYQDAIFPDAPNGIIDRIRIDSIVIVPDKALPLNGGLPGNNPNTMDSTVDLQWGFNSDLLSGTFYSDHTTHTDSNPFFFESSLLHELGHARYLIDTYAMDIDTTSVKIMEGNNFIAGTPLMPIIAWNILYYNNNPTLMSGYNKIGIYEVMPLNLIAHRRAVCGNMNAPCNIGIFINDLPANNYIKFKDQNNNVLSNACVTVYNSVPGSQSVIYSKYFDNVPDYTFTTDTNGVVNVGRNPFSAPNMPIWGPAGMDIIIRIEQNGKVGYRVVQASDFNLEYWRGHTTSGNYTYQVNMYPCSNFSGATCNCSLAITPPTISASGPLTFCQGGSVTLSSSSNTGNQWYKNGIAISGANSATLVVNSSGSYTATLTSNGNQSSPSNAIVVTVNPSPPTPTISAGSATTFCAGGSVTLTSNASSGNQWYKDGVAISGQTNTTLNVTTSGSYTAIVTAGGCQSAASNSIVVTVNLIPPIPTITAVGNILQSSASSGNQWYFNGSIISGATSQQYTVQASGLYTVQVTVNNCSAMSASYNFVATATVDPSAWNYDVTLFPNPVNENLYITNRSNRKLVIRVIDITGEYLQELNLNTANGTIDMKKFAKGIYVVCITDKKRNETIYQIVLKQ